MAQSKRKVSQVCLKKHHLKLHVPSIDKIFKFIRQGKELKGQKRGCFCKVNIFWKSRGKSLYKQEIVWYRLDCAEIILISWLLSSFICLSIVAISCLLLKKTCLSKTCTYFCFIYVLRDVLRIRQLGSGSKRCMNLTFFSLWSSCASINNVTGNSPVYCPM